MKWVNLAERQPPFLSDVIIRTVDTKKSGYTTIWNNCNRLIGVAAGTYPSDEFELFEWLDETEEQNTEENAYEFLESKFGSNIALGYKPYPAGELIGALVEYCNTHK